MKIFLILLTLLNTVPAFCADKINWQTWTPDLFDRAKKEKKLVILDLEAIWCHWCHVMDEKTYSDAKVIKMMNSKYIAVKVDQDSRPDLSNRYEDYGWPATILFSSAGQELVKRSGYIEPDRMLSLLRAVVDDPTPGPSVKFEQKMAQAAEQSSLSSGLQKEIRETIFDAFDFKKGGWKTSHKFLDWNFAEWALQKGIEGDKKLLSMAKQSLDGELQLVDPAWGGVYQYSVDFKWTEPHFEKIINFQAEIMRLFAEASAITGEAKYLQAAKDVHKFIAEFLTSPEGGFYTSQDADLVEGEHGGEFFKLGDKERRKKGIPKIDKHVYSRENGWVITALTVLSSVTSEPEYLKGAEKAAEWIVKNRSLSSGGFKHGDSDQAGPYLGDTLTMGFAFLNLYETTAKREWLKRSEEAMKFIMEKFRPRNKDVAGFVTAASSSGSFETVPTADENFLLARFANRLFSYTGEGGYRAAAESAMKFLLVPERAKRLYTTSEVLLADSELSNPPVHITVVGHKDDPKAAELFSAALKYPHFYRRVEWWDKREGPLRSADVTYPELEKAAAFACGAGRCSLPVFDADKIKDRVLQISKK